MIFFLLLQPRISASATKTILFLLCNHLGVPLAPDRMGGPYTALQFVGITLDSVRMEAPLPEEKLQKCCNLLTDFLSRRSVCLKELQSLIGLLKFT